MFETLIDEFVGLSAPELDAVIAEAELARRDAEARLGAAAAVVDARGSYRDDGHRSMRGYLKATLNCSGSAANKIRKRAAVVNALPTVGAALLEGRIGSEQVDLLAKAHSHRVAGAQFPAFADRLVDNAEHFEHDDFATIIDHFIQRGDPDGSFDDQQFRENERVASVAVVNGAVEVSASGGSPLAAAEMHAIFLNAVEAEFHKDCAARRAEHGEGALAAPLPRTAQQRKFDAMHSIFMASVSVAPGATAPEPLVNIVIDHVTAGRVLHSHGLSESADMLGVGSGELEANLLNRQCSVNGTPVHPDVALQATLTGRVRRAVVDTDSVIIDLGRTQRLFTGKARDAAQLLAVTCTLPGCDIPARLCDIDHRAEWVAGSGPTDQHNAMPLCGTHDRWKHTNKIRSRRATNGRIHLIRPDGTTILAAGQSEPNWAEPPTEPHGQPLPKPSPDAPQHWAGLGRRIETRDFAARGIDPDVEWPIYEISFDELVSRDP